MSKPKTDSYGYRTLKAAALLREVSRECVLALRGELAAVQQMRSYMEKQMVALRHAQELTEERLQKVEYGLKMKRKKPS